MNFLKLLVFRRLTLADLLDMSCAVESERRRLEALRNLDILDTPREAAFDDLVGLASRLLSAPMALISLVEEDRQWFKACVGLQAEGSSRDVSFCSHAIAQKDRTRVFVVPDATEDARFSNNPFVTGEPHIRFYAGAPLVTRCGEAIGSLCVIDRVPRRPTEDQLDTLRVLARAAVSQMELRRAAEDLRESESRTRLILDSTLDAIITVDADRLVTDWNPRAVLLFGYRRDDVIGRPLETLIGGPVGPNKGVPLAALFGVHDAAPRQAETMLKRADNGHFAAEVSVCPSPLGERMTYSVFVRDITDRKREERERLEAETREVVIFAMARLAESRDPETGAHIERVQTYCRALAEQLARSGAFPDTVDPEFTRLMYTTSPLHDIGKVGIPDDILLKPGRLSDREFEIMKMHASIGAETLAAAMGRFPNARFLRMARNIAATHHERFDGSGYPKGLKGEEIPLCGRIVAVADVYDALTSRRVYKAAFTFDVARGIIAKESGKHFDPRIVDAFLAIEDEFRAIYSRFAEGVAAAAPPLTDAA